MLGHRGQLEELERLIERFAEMDQSGDEQERSAYRSGVARFHLASGKLGEALAAAEDAFASHEHFGLGAEQIKEAYATAGEAALLLGDVDRVAELIAFVDSLPRGGTNLFLDAQSSRFRAHLAYEADPTEGDRLFGRAAELFRELSAPFPLAVVQIEHAERLVAVGGRDGAAELAAEARQTFERLGAAPWLERLEALEVSVGATA